MSGVPVRRMRRQYKESLALAEKLAAAGDEAGAAAAREEAEKFKAALAELGRGVVASARGTPAHVVMIKEVREVVRSPTAERDAARLAARPSYYPVAAITEAPEPLTEEEFGRAACVMSAVADGSGGRDASDGADLFLADAFPCLSPENRVRAARYLSCLASAELRPSGGRSAASDEALKSAGLPYASFEALRKREKQFDDACLLIEKARRRALMAMLEETLLERAFDGVDEESVGRDGEIHTVRRHDNRLAFDILRNSHEHYVKVGAGKTGKDGFGKDGGGGMTLMIANGVPQMPASAKQPKTVEGISRA